MIGCSARQWRHLALAASTYRQALRLFCPMWPEPNRLASSLELFAGAGIGQSHSAELQHKYILGLNGLAVIWKPNNRCR